MNLHKNNTIQISIKENTEEEGKAEYRMKRQDDDGSTIGETGSSNGSLHIRNKYKYIILIIHIPRTAYRNSAI